MEEKYCETTSNIEYLSFGVMQVQGKKYVTIDVLPHVNIVLHDTLCSVVGGLWISGDYIPMKEGWKKTLGYLNISALMVIK